MYLTWHESVFCHHVVRRRRSFRGGTNLVLSLLVLTLVFRELVLILVGLRTV